MNIKIKILMMTLMLPFLGYCKKVKHLNIELLNIVLTSEDNVLVNDSLELSTIKSYFMKGFIYGKIEYYKYADTIISIIMNNREFFIGLGYRDIERMIGDISSGNLYASSYRMTRWI